MMSVEMSITSEAIRDIRSRLGLTQCELAEELNVTRDAVANWENGRTGISGPAEVLLRQLGARADAKMPAGK